MLLQEFCVCICFNYMQLENLCGIDQLYGGKFYSMFRRENSKSCLV
jgi:hypothetical protein